MRGTESLEGIIELGYAFRGAKLLMSAVELDVFSALAPGPLDIGELRQRLGIAERGAGDFLDALVAFGLLIRDSNGRYANGVSAGQYLAPDAPSYIGGLIANLNAREYATWDKLTEALRTGAPQTGFAGPRHFAELYANIARLRTYARGMTCASLAVAEALASKFPWKRHRSVMDIGTAEGCTPVQIVRAHAHLEGGGFDLPALKPLFDDYVRGCGLSERLRFVPGDFFTDPLPTTDVLIMGRVLHNWDLPTKRMLLQKAYEALPADGALIVYERMIDDDRRSGRAGLLSSLNMLLMTAGGFDFSVADCIDWMRDTGFRDMRSEPLIDDHVMVVAKK